MKIGDLVTSDHPVGCWAADGRSCDPHRRIPVRHQVTPGEFYIIVGLETGDDLSRNFVVVNRGGNVFAVGEGLVRRVQS